MTTALILYTLLVGSLVALGAQALAAAARLARLPTRWCWAGALTATVILAALAPLRAHNPTALRMPSAQIAVVSGASTTGPTDRLAEWITAARSTTIAATESAFAAVERRVPPRVDSWLPRVCLALAGIALTLLVAMYVRFAVLRRRWPQAHLNGARVRVAPALGPAVIGVARPEIVIPAWLLACSPREQALVIAHEKEHVRARDPLLLAVGWFAAAILPWHPAVWWLLSRLSLAVELDCDARMLRRGVTPRAYGTLLIDLAGRCSGFPAPLPALADVPSHLERRLLAMQVHRPRLTLLRGTVLSVVTLVAVLAACEAKLPTSAEIARMDVAAAERQASPLLFRMPSADSVTSYMIDGRPATAAQVHAIPAERIATIMVEKRVGRETRSSIRITTHNGAAVNRMNLEPAAPGEVRTVVHTVRPGEAAPLAEEIRTPDKFDGVVLIDGVRVEPSALSKLSPNAIATVEIIKGEPAAKMYDAPEARNGVLRITTVQKGAK